MYSIKTLKIHIMNTFLGKYNNLVPTNIPNSIAYKQNLTNVQKEIRKVLIHHLEIG